MKIELINNDDPRLKVPCEKITDFENKEFYQNLINQIMEASVGNYAFAAAAPQFGINKRFILMISAIEKKVKNKNEKRRSVISFCTSALFLCNYSFFVLRHTVTAVAPIKSPKTTATSTSVGK